MKNLLEEYPLHQVEAVNSLRDMLARSAQIHPDKTALRDLSKTPISDLTFSLLHQYVLRFGKALLEMGLKERDHVAVISENRAQWGLAYLTCAAFNFIVAPIDAKLKENEILTILHASEARAVVFSEPFREQMQQVRHTLKGLEFFIDMDLREHDERARSMKELIDATPYDGSATEHIALNPEELFALVFTSGSMGSAKGVMLSQKNIISNLRAMLQMMEIQSNDRFLSILPIHHTYECTCGMLCPLYQGASVHFARSLKTVAEDMMTVRPTIVLGVPLLYEKMYKRITAAIEEKKLTAAIINPLFSIMSALEAVGVKNLRRKIFGEVHAKFGGAIRILIVGAASPDRKVAEGFRALGFNFIQGYGLTECSPILTLNRLRKFKDEAAGLPLPNIQLRITDVDQEGRGEIIAKGDSIMLGYYKNEAATSAALRDGWFSTGDYGFIDDDGFLHICGRKKNVIISRTGKNVFPEELEEQLNKIPYILESVVYGVKEADGDEVIAAMVVPSSEALIDYEQRTKETLTKDKIALLINDEVRQLNKHLQVYKQIRKVVIKDTEFEKTTTQKIKRYLVNTE
jgi:long-chain acyl-CoA synthetase